jgi:prolyl oligopeptidase
MNVKGHANRVLNATVLALSACLVVIGCSGGAPQLPETSIIAVTDTYHGVEVVDNYRWLENGDDPEVRQWSEAQNKYARWVLDHIPARETIATRLQELYNQASPEYYWFQYRGGVLFAFKDQPPKDQPLLVKMESPDNPGTEQVILDPNQLDATGATSIDFYVVSPDAELVAVSLSKDGTEDGDVHVYDVGTGKSLPDVVPRVNGPTAGGDVAWTEDGSGFYYTRYPRSKERPPEDMRFYQQVYYHRLGTSTEEDAYVIGQEFPRIAEIEFETSDDARYVLAGVANGDGGEFAHYLLDPSGKWKQITQFSDMITQGKFGPDGGLYLLSHKDAPRGKILSLPPGEIRLSRAKTVVAESEVVIQSFLSTASKIYVRDLVGGPSQIRMLDQTGNFQGLLPLMPVSSVREMISLGKDNILFRNSSYTEPSVCYTFEPSQGEPLRTALYVTSPADFSDVEVIREFAVSKDGTRVPMNILRRKGTKLEGNNPTILYGYGGYGVSQTPRYDRTLSLWLDQGGVYVIANLRGGGEFGEEWHKAGNLTNKQNVFDDFAACAQYLIETGYTNPAKLAIKGGSNGGLLVGATMTQHPDLFRAVVCHKGVLDMLRVELDPNGEFNITEFGTVKDPEHFRALYAYSPYHNVVDGTHYPHVLMTADENDGRVNPSNSRKMIARLQAATSSEGYVLLRMSSGSGHGIGSALSQDIALYADTYAFLFDRLGVDFKPVAPASE